MMDRKKYFVERGRKYPGSWFQYVRKLGSEKEQENLRWFKDPKPVREVSLVTHRSFLKRKMTEALFNEIMNSIPNDIKSKKNTKVVKWN